MVAGKRLHKTDLKLTLGHETQSAEYGKIDPDRGLQSDLGPSLTLRAYFAAANFPLKITAVCGTQATRHFRVDARC
jgi:hypothetical protein